MEPRHRSRDFTDLLNTVAAQCTRFWVPRGTEPDLSDDGFLVDSESSYFSSAVGFEELADFPILGLLGEPGMGKSVVLHQLASNLQTASQEPGDRLLNVDLTACGTDTFVCKKIFESPQFKSWKNDKSRLHVLLDGFDTCLQYVENLVALLLDGFAEGPPERLSLRIACRSAHWPADLETGLKKLSGEDTVAIYEIAPLRRTDAQAAAVAVGCSGAAFLAEVDRLGASQFANRPITLRFLLNSFQTGKALPAQRTDLYREGCLVLCDECREDLRRSRRWQRLSSSQRFALASRLAAISVFSQSTAFWTGSRQDLPPPGDVRLDELLGGEERFGRETVGVITPAIRETLKTGLFRSVGRHRIAFAHQTYAEFLAAEYLVHRGLEIPEMLRLVLHPDNSGRVVPQLRETAAWLAGRVPDFCSALLAKDPATLFASDTPPPSEADRRIVVIETLKLFDYGELHDIHLVAAAAARLKYAGIAKDLEPYLRDESRSEIARRAAVLIAQLTGQVALQEDFIRLALDDEGPPNLRVAAAVAVREIGNASAKAALKPLVTISSDRDPDDQLKGNAISATWPEHLTADELFAALTPPQRPNFIGAYRQFLSSDFATLIRPPDRIRALQWAETHITRSAKTTPLGLAALRIVAAAIDWSHEFDLRPHVVNLLIKIAQLRVRDLSIMTKLSSNPDARAALARAAIRACPDRWSASCLKSYGVIQEADLNFLLTELEAAPLGAPQEKLAFLVAQIVSQFSSFNTEAMERVFETAHRNAALTHALRPVLAVELGSEQAELLKSSYKAREEGHEPPSLPEVAPDIGDLIGHVENGEADAFAKICYRLAGPSGDPAEGKTLPGWEMLQPDIQAQVLRAAKMYLQNYRVADTSCDDTCLWRYEVIYGYWALRLLAGVAPEDLNNLTPETWHAWMPSVFGNSYMRENPDALQTPILKTAYQRDSSRFREILARLIDAQIREDISITPRAFRTILATLMKAGDDEAARIASETVTAASSATRSELGKPVEAALELLDNDPSGAWQVVWPVARANQQFAECLVGRLAVDPYSRTTTHIIQALRETDLADLQIWLWQSHPAGQEGDQRPNNEGLRAGQLTPIASGRDWHCLGIVVMNALIQRGTPDAIQAIRRIDEEAPGENLRRVTELAQESVWKKTWTPMAPAELLDLVAGGDARQSEFRTDIQRHPNTDQPTPPTLPFPPERQFRRANETYSITFAGKSISLAGKVGLAYLGHLLREPGHEFTCLELQAAERQNGVSDRGKRVSHGGTKRDDLRPVLDAEERAGMSLAGTVHDQVLDEKGRKLFKKRLKIIDEELMEAKDDDDTARLSGEKQRILDAINSAHGLGGRARRFSTDTDNARKAVAKAIKDAIKKIEKLHPALAEHFANSVHTGRSCYYLSDGVKWEV